MNQTTTRILVVAATLGVAGFAALPARADYTSFPAQGDYGSSGVWADALWSFQITINPAAQPYFASLYNGGLIPGSSYANGILTSPLLYDSSGQIQIGASSPFVGPAGPTGVPVGGASPANVLDSALTAPAGWTDTGGRKVYTRINGINATDTAGNGYSLLVGSAASDQTASVGEAQSLSGTQIPANDFPAQSFFDIFCDVTIPNAGTLYNSAPAITSYGTPLTGTAGAGAGPYAIQLFQQTYITPVTVYARTDNLNAGWYAGDAIGTLQLIPYGGLAVPEPASPALLGLGTCILLARRGARPRPAVPAED